MVWCRPVFRAQGSHCTLVWRRFGFESEDISAILKIRTRFLEGASHTDVRTKAGKPATRTGMYNYELDPACGLSTFVRMVRDTIPKEWPSDLANLAPCVTARRGEITEDRMLTEAMAEPTATAAHQGHWL